jgi:hypothetical protein
MAYNAALFVNPITVTGLLLKWGQGDEGALERLIPLVHNHPRRETHRVRPLAPKLEYRLDRTTEIARRDRSPTPLSEPARVKSPSVSTVTEFS